MRTTMLTSRLASLALLALAAAVAPAMAGGPPVLSVQFPVDPLDPDAAGAAILVHANSCGVPADFAVKAAAEGVVDGKRQSLPLELKRTSRTGVRALSASWPEHGKWVIVLSGERGEATSTLVELGGEGGVDRQDYHGRSIRTPRVTSVHVLDHAATERDLAPYFRAAVAAR